MQLLILGAAAALCIASQPRQVISTDLEIRKLHIRSDIAFRFATTKVTSLLANANINAREATFRVTLPKTAFITNFSMIIDGQTINGAVKEKAKAKRQYQQAVQRGQSAGHVAATTRNSNKFAVSVNVAGGEKVTFTLLYQEVLQRRRGHYHHVINIDPGHVVPDLVAEVSINESRPITDLSMPPVRKDIENAILGDQQNKDAVITRTGQNSAFIVYKPSVASQKQASEKGLAGQLLVRYDVTRALDGGEIQVVDGYFVHTVAPQGLPPVPKNVLFILDVSGSMMGRKMEQVKDAMNTILDELQREDAFSLLTFDDSFTYWSESLAKVDSMSIRNAKKFVKNMQAHGMTNIHGAITRGISFLGRQSESDRQRHSIIIFLTDGDPTAGVTNPSDIRRRVTAANDGRYAIFSLGFGEGVEFSFLKQLSLQNNGLARKIYEASDASLQLRDFYREVSLPLLSDVTIKYHTHGGSVAEITKHTFKSYFSGSEMVVAGRLVTPGGGTLQGSYVRPCVQGTSASGRIIKLCLPGAWPPVSPVSPPVPSPNPSWTPKTGLATYIERMWAYLTIRSLLDQELSASNRTEQKQLRERALALSLRYHFVTQLTSMVVTLPNSSDSNIGSLRDSYKAQEIIDLLYKPIKLTSLQQHSGRSVYRGRSRPRGIWKSASNVQQHWVRATPGTSRPYRHKRPARQRYRRPSIRVPHWVPSNSNAAYIRPPNHRRRMLPRLTSTVQPRTSAPVVGEPSLSIKLPSGVVCMSWPQMALSTHFLIKAKGIQVTARHGRNTKIRFIAIKAGGKRYVISTSVLLLDKRRHRWGQKYSRTNVRVSGNKAELQPIQGVKLSVHRTSSSSLFVEIVDLSGATKVRGLLRNARSWMLRGRTPHYLQIPSRHGLQTVQVRPFAFAGHPVCWVAQKDIITLARLSRKA